MQTSRNQFKALAFLDEAGSIDPGFRRDLVKWIKMNPLLGIANVRASAIARTIGLLLSNAMRLVGVAEYGAGFFDAEEAARRWIAAREAKRRDRNRPPG